MRIEPRTDPAEPTVRRGPPSGVALAAERLAAFLEGHRPVLALTGAGCSTESGIPDYRDEQGRWKTTPPMLDAVFRRSEAARRRYWARSLLGWPRIAAARPNEAHRALARLEAKGLVRAVVTQNVDGLHQKAGSRRVLDLHGRLDRVVCLDCGAAVSRARLQREMEASNPGWVGLGARPTPDGDAEIAAGIDVAAFRVPACRRCGGRLQPDVVFFGASVPRPRVERAFAELEAARGLLVVGSSLAVWSGYRFVRRAGELGRPVALVNLGRTRADGEVALKIEAPCGAVLPRAEALVAPRPF